MSLTKLTDNLNVIQTLSDKPTQTASELKQKFDEAGNKIKGYINNTLTGEIDTKFTTDEQNIATNTQNISTNTQDISTLNTKQTALEEKVNNIFESIESGSHSGKIRLGKILIQWGRTNVDNVPATGYVQTEVFFEEQYTSVPNFFAQTNGNYNILTSVSSNDSSSAFVNTRALDGSAKTGRWFDWIVIGISDQTQNL